MRGPAIGKSPVSGCHCSLQWREVAGAQVRQQECVGTSRNGEENPF